MTVRLSREAAKALRGLDSKLVKRLLVRLEQFDELGYGDAQPLRGQDGEYRLRVGDYRAIFELLDGDVVVLRVGHRREVYR